VKPRIHPAYRASGLEDRQAKRLAERREARSRHLKSVRPLTDEQQTRQQALAYMAGLPTNQLLAVYRAAIQRFKP
jgi:hypothetical protein